MTEEELEKEDPLAAERAHERDDIVTEAGPITGFGYVAEPTLQAYVQEQEEMLADENLDEEATQAMYQRQMEEYQQMRRQGYQVGVESHLASDGYENSPYHGGESWQGSYYDEQLQSPLQARSTHPSTPSYTARGSPNSVQHRSTASRGHYHEDQRHHATQYRSSPAGQAHVPSYVNQHTPSQHKRQYNDYLPTSTNKRRRYQ